MSFSKTGGEQGKDSSKSDYNVNILHSFPDQMDIETSIQPPEQQSGSSDKPYKLEDEPTIDFPISPSAHKSFGSVREEYKLIFQRAQQIKSINEQINSTTLSSNTSDAKPSPKKKNDVFLQSTSAIKKKTGTTSSISRPPLFKDFSRDLFELPLTKQKLTESISLGKACGFLKYFMKLNRTDLTGKEQQLDHVLVELQKALRDAKSICIKLENTSKRVPLDINDLVVEAEKLMYLLSSSFRIFEKLDQFGSVLMKDLQAYSKDKLDYHVSTDILLEYIVEGIVEGCRQIKRNY